MRNFAKHQVCLWPNSVESVRLIFIQFWSAFESTPDNACAVKSEPLQSRRIWIGRPILWPNTWAEVKAAWTILPIDAAIELLAAKRTSMRSPLTTLDNPSVSGLPFALPISGR